MFRLSLVNALKTDREARSRLGIVRNQVAATADNIHGGVIIAAPRLCEKELCG